MDMMEVMRVRHSVRSFTDRLVEPAAAQALREALEQANQEHGLHMQLVLDEPAAFSGPLAHYGKFHNVKNYIALVGPKNAQRSIGCGGEQAVLLAQSLGLNTCWVAFIARKKSHARVPAGKTLRIGIAVGYGTTQGSPRKTKTIAELSAVERGETPEWFALAMEAAQLAPTAMNNQHFRITLRADGRTVSAQATKSGAWDAIDLGIVKRNFEEAANEAGADWRWE